LYTDNITATKLLVQFSVRWFGHAFTPDCTRIFLADDKYSIGDNPPVEQSHGRVRELPGFVTEREPDEEDGDN
jgi:hypothetical protein